MKPVTISKSVESSFSGQILEHHFYQGSSNDCGPYCTAMLLHTFQKSQLDAKDLAETMNNVHWLGPLPLIRRIRNWATFPWGVSDVLNQHGLKSSFHLWTSLEMLQESLHSGIIPIVIFGEWRPMWAHYTILLAFDPQQGVGFSDPAYPELQLHWRPLEEFYRLWSNYGRMSILITPSSSSSSNN